jgi:hypothetical protein
MSRPPPSGAYLGIGSEREVRVTGLRYSGMPVGGGLSIRLRAGTLYVYVKAGWAEEWRTVHSKSVRTPGAFVLVQFWRRCAWLAGARRGATLTCLA